jgi:hypothetical protein
LTARNDDAHPPAPPWAGTLPRGPALLPLPHGTDRHPRSLQS